jgi:flagellar hook-associated protein 1 FlgK
VTTPVTLTYDSAANTLTGFPAGMPVTVTTNGVPTTYPAGTPVPFTAGSVISFGGAEVKISGAPANGDTFTISANTNGDGDNRNMLALGELQTKNVLQGGTASYNSAYSQLVSLVGNKTRELQTNSASEGALLKQMQTAQQSESGVNLDEEATNLLRYQQAYQASGKVMQAVSDMFDVLISLGR